MASRLRRLVIAVATASIVCVGVTTTVAPVFAQGGPLRWAKAAPFPEPEEELYGTVIDGKFYVLGGFGIGGNAPGLVYEYDPATDRWTKKKEMPVHVHHQAQTTLNGKLYMFGGCLKG